MHGPQQQPHYKWWRWMWWLYPAIQNSPIPRGTLAIHLRTKMTLEGTRYGVFTWKIKNALAARAVATWLVVSVPLIVHSIPYLIISGRHILKKWRQTRTGLMIMQPCIENKRKNMCVLCWKTENTQRNIDFFQRWLIARSATKRLKDCPVRIVKRSLR